MSWVVALVVVGAFELGMIASRYRNLRSDSELVHQLVEALDAAQLLLDQSIEANRAAAARYDLAVRETNHHDKALRHIIDVTGQTAKRVDL